MSASIIACPHCGAKNRIPPGKAPEEAKCGRCHQPLPPITGQASQPITLRCSQCHARNRVPLEKLHEGARCGRCGAPLAHRDIFSDQPVVVTDANFSQIVMKSPLPVLLYGWAPWCSVCSGINSMVDHLAGEVKGKIRVGKLNIDANPKLAAQYDVLSVPTFFIFDAGELKERMSGAVPKHELMFKMTAYL